MLSAVVLTALLACEKYVPQNPGFGGSLPENRDQIKEVSIKEEDLPGSGEVYYILCFRAGKKTFSGYATDGLRNENGVYSWNDLDSGEDVATLDSCEYTTARYKGNVIVKNIAIEELMGFMMPYGPEPFTLAEFKSHSASFWKKYKVDKAELAEMNAVRAKIIRWWKDGQENELQKTYVYDTIEAFWNGRAPNKDPLSE